MTLSSLCEPQLLKQWYDWIEKMQSNVQMFSERNERFVPRHRRTNYTETSHSPYTARLPATYNRIQLDQQCDL